MASEGSRMERFGLIGMRERAERLGGTFQWQNDNGVRVVVSLPLEVMRSRTESEQ